MEAKKWAVQETIGGWKQTPVEFDTYEEAYRYYENELSMNNAVNLLPSDEVEIDYLD